MAVLNSQLPAEVVVQPTTTHVHLSQLPFEVIYTTISTSNVLLSQFAIEVVLPYITVPYTRTKFGPKVQVI